MIGFDIRVMITVKHAFLLDVDCFGIAVELYLFAIVHLGYMLLFIVSILFSITHQRVLSLSKPGLTTKNFMVLFSLND